MHKRFILLILIATLLTSTTFTNCAQNPQSAAVPEAAFLSEDEKLKILSSEFKGKVTAQFCKSESSYACMKRVYSRNIENQNRGFESACLGHFCVRTQVFHFNSSEAQVDCVDCSEALESSEFDCHLKIANHQGIYPLIVTSQELSDAIEKLSDYCHTQLAREP